MKIRHLQFAICTLHFAYVNHRRRNVQRNKAKYTCITQERENIVCPCLYPLIIIDKRYDESLNYISIPEEVFEDEGNIDNPEFEEVEEKGFDNKIHKYMAVIWKDPKDLKNAFTKKYDVNDHIVVAGCQASTDGKKMKCKRKELYVVLHPIDEWIKHHIVHVK